MILAYIFFFAKYIDKHTLVGGHYHWVWGSQVFSSCFCDVIWAGRIPNSFFFFFSNGLGAFKLMIIKNTTVIAKMKFDAHPQSDGGEGFFFVAGGLQCGTNSSKIVMN